MENNGEDSHGILRPQVPRGGIPTWITCSRIWNLSEKDSHNSEQNVFHRLFDPGLRRNSRLVPFILILELSLQNILCPIIMGSLASSQSFQTFFQVFHTLAYSSAREW